MRYYLLFIIFSLQLSIAYSQLTNYASPLNIPSVLSASFAELRANRFHAGIDFKTQGKTGLPVFSITDGYISRIKIQSGGYGKAIYINHNDGNSSIYAHLDGFIDIIDEYVKNYQYNFKQHSVDIFLDPSEFKVTKGQLIALSGNTGYSFGPHLHFEIRNPEFYPINPLTYDFNVLDNQAPFFEKLSIYPINNGLINNNDTTTQFKTVKTGSIYSVEKKIIASGDIAFGVLVYDRFTESNNKCGIIDLKVLANNDTILHYHIDKIGFDETRYINAFMDYGHFTKTKEHLNRLYILPNNQLSIYKSAKNRGILSINKDTIYSIRIIAEDSYKNASSLEFNINGVANAVSKIKDIDSSKLFLWNKPNSFINNDLRVIMPAYIFYDNLVFNYSKIDSCKACPYGSHLIGNTLIPIHKPYQLAIKVQNINDLLKPKLCIAKRYGNGRFWSIGGEYTDGYVITNTTEFGEFAVMADTIAPTIKLKSDLKIPKPSKIVFEIKDELSGIQSYNGYIDNKWALFEYDLKNEELIYYSDAKRIKSGINHNIKVVVIDDKGNERVFTGKFFY